MFAFWVVRAQVSSLVASQDREFLSVYRVHMHGVHRELEMARMEALAAEEMLKDDKTVAALQAEHTWFQEECARLDALTAGMNKDLRYLKSRQAAVKAQNRELSRQLKAQRREIKRMQLQRNALLQSQRDDNAADERAQIATESLTARELLEPNLRPGNRSAPRTASSTRQHKRTELSVEAIEAELFELEMTRSEEQEILEDCVKEVAEFVLERKNQAIQPARFAGQQNEEAVKMSPTLTHSNTCGVVVVLCRKGDRLHLVKGVSGLGLSHFTESDRCVHRAAL